MSDNLGSPKRFGAAGSEPVPDAHDADLSEVMRKFPDAGGRATTVRYRVIGVSVLMAFILYLDRVCLGEIVKLEMFLADFSGDAMGAVMNRDELRAKIGDTLAAFFWTYASFQIPTGWASDRFGARKMLTFYIVGWSLMTIFTGLAATLTGLLFARLALGLAQAGAYPTSGGIIRRWFRTENRSIASGWVSMGGRIGGAVAPVLTVFLVNQLGSWRLVLGIYGVVGLAIAAAYYWIVRERPSEHPAVNEAEVLWIGAPADDHRSNLGDILPMLWACCLSRTLWLISLVQFATNVGWAFLITWLPTYLIDHGVSNFNGGLLLTIILGVGIPAQLIGGWVGDWCVIRYGIRWGRVLPGVISSMIAGIAYVACIGFDGVWVVVTCFAIVSFMTDVKNPPFWALIQDIGGRNTSGIFAWSNMWGNFGAALTSSVLPRLAALGTSMGYGNGDSFMFVFLGGAFFLSGVATLGMDATKLVQPPRDPGTETAS